jgi:hypothetical protein
MKIDDLQSAADTAKAYQDIDSFIRFASSSGCLSEQATRIIRLTVGGSSASWDLPCDEFLTLLLSRREHLKKELTELGVEV